MGHFLQSFAIVFFWILSAMFAVGLIGCAFVILLTTIDDLKEIVTKEKEPTMVSNAHFVSAD